MPYLLFSLFMSQNSNCPSPIGGMNASKSKNRHIYMFGLFCFVFTRLQCVGQLLQFEEIQSLKLASL